IKVLLNLALIAGDALVRGGQLDVGAESNDGQVEIVVRADGPRIVLDAEMRAALTGTQGEAVITPRAAAAYLVQALVAEGGGIVQVSDPEDSVLLFGAAFKAG
ncbi:histidine phosphotransferase family protein, partial [Pseudomonas sp. MPR-AND1A]